MFLEGRVGPSLVRKFVSAVSCFHELQGLESPTRTPLVSAMIQGYISKTSSDCAVSLKRVRLSATAMQRILAHGLESALMEDVGHCSLVVFPSIYQCRAISAAHGAKGNITVTASSVTAALTRGRGQRAHRRPLHLRYPMQPGLSRLDQLHRIATQVVCRQTLKLRLLQPPRWCPPRYRPLWRRSDPRPTCYGHSGAAGHYYGSHSARIGGFNELLGLGFGSAWIMNRLDWVAAGMLQVYYDSCLSVTAASRWFFAHMLPPGCRSERISL